MTHGASKTFIVAGALATASLAGIGSYAYVESHRPAVLELFILDTPGYPAIFMRTPDDRRILVDGGSNSEIIRHITDILPFYSRRIDMVIATDEDPRNVTGLVDVLDRYAVDTVVIPALSLPSLGLASSSDQIYESFLTAANAHGMPVREASAGERLALGGSTTADILFPTSAELFKYSRASAPGIMMRISYGTTSVLLIGGSSLKAQKFLAANYATPVDALITSASANASNLSLELVEFSP